MSPNPLHHRVEWAQIAYLLENCREGVLDTSKKNRFHVVRPNLILKNFYSEMIVGTKIVYLTTVRVEEHENDALEECLFKMSEAYFRR